MGRKWLRVRKLRSRESLKEEARPSDRKGIRVLFERIHMRLSQPLLGLSGTSVGPSMKEAHQAVKKGLVGGVGSAEGETSPSEAKP